LQHLIERESGKVVLYLTTLGVIRETFNRCVKVRQILRTLLIKVEERDVFMSKENQHELGQRMGSRMPTLPQVFVDGQYLGVSPI
jgi:glutaredoxin domain-containing cysteine-rich protein 1